jgi:hypothetical protein
MSQIVLGFDPGWAKPIAWAISDHEHCHEVGTLPPGKELEFGHVYQCFENTAKYYSRVQAVFIELGHPGNTKVMEQMAMVAGALRICFVPKIPVFFTPYAEWTGSFGIRRGTRKTVAQPMYLNIASYYKKDLPDLGYNRVLTGDVAAAICISIFGSRRLG